MVWAKHKEERYLTVIKELLQFIEETYNKWIKESGDLFSAVRKNEDGTLEFLDDGRFGSLIDLLTVQYICVEEGFVRSAGIDRMIKSRIKYLKKTGVDILHPKQSVKNRGSTDIVAELQELYNKVYK
jgi:hypothetical protein